MGKKKERAGKAKLPKRMAGIKLPKEVRRKGEALMARAASPAGQAAIARGLTMAAGLASVAAERSRRKAADLTPEESGEGAAASTPAQPLDPQKVAEAVSTVADAVLGRLFGAKK